MKLLVMFCILLVIVSLSLLAFVILLVYAFGNAVIAFIIGPVAVVLFIGVAVGFPSDSYVYLVVEVDLVPNGLQ